MKTILLTIIAAFIFLSVSAQTTYVVFKPGDPDPYKYPYDFNDSKCDPVMYGTLQWAIRKSLETPGECLIVFNIPGTGPFTISLNYSLPIIEKEPIIIDATSQPGYSIGNPQIILDGNFKQVSGLYFNNIKNSGVKGVVFKHFISQAVIFNFSYLYTLSDCYFTENGSIDSRVQPAAIRIVNSTNGNIKGNFVGVDPQGNETGNNAYGIVMSDFSDNNTIGGTNPNEGNVIVKNYMYGLWITKGSRFNKISGNIIYGQERAIVLTEGNNMKHAPVIHDYNSKTNVLRGVSEPNDIIEVFGSTGDENARSYINTITADANGNWEVLITSNNYSKCIATASDNYNNTSQLSGAFFTDLPKTHLISSDCNKSDMTKTELLTCEKIPEADKYEFYIKETITGNSESLIKTTNSFNFNELSIPFHFKSEYVILVRSQILGQWSEFGDTCKNGTKELAFYGCDTASFTINIDQLINPGNVIDVIVNLPIGVIALDTAIIDYFGGSININNLDESNPIYQITNVDTNHLEFTYYAIINCDAFVGGTYLTFNVENISLNGGMISQDTINYSISNPYFELIESSCQNINYVADYNEQFERIFYYEYDSPQSINCEFIFTDTLWADNNNTWVRLDTIELISPTANFTILETVITDSILSIKLNFNGLQDGDPIIFKELVTRISCDDGLSPDNSISNFFANFGCLNGDLCAHVNANISNTTVRASGNTPQLTYIMLNPGYQSCWNDTIRREMKIINNGTADASSVSVLFSHNLLDITELDLSDMEFFTRDAPGVETPIIDTTISTVTTIYWYLSKTKVDINRELVVGDSIFFRYNELVHCINDTNYNFHFNQTTGLHYDGYPNVTLVHECGNQSASYPIPPYTPSHWMPTNWEQYFSLKQFFNSTVGTMEGEINQEEWFDVTSLEPLVISDWGMFYGQGFIYDVTKSELQVKMILDSGLSLVDTLCYMYSNNPSAPGNFYPFSVDKILGPGGDGTGDTIIAHFYLDNNFYDPTNTVLHYQSTSDYFDDFFSDFNVRFRIRSHCAPQFDGGPATMTEEFYLVPNIECDENCKVPLAKASFDVIINCPGCKLPGWNLQAFDVHRKNFGYADNNNNNFPDIPNFETTSADLSLANVDHVMIGDTLEFTIKGITSEAEQSGYYFVNIEFPYNYGQFQIKGNVVDELEFLGAEGKYYSILTGDSSDINLTGSYPEIDIITDEMNIDISPSQLHAYGLDPAVDRFYGSPASSDSIEMTFRFRVKENLDFGTSPTQYYSIEDLTVFLNMSGTPFPVLSTYAPAWDGYRKVDANPVLENDPVYFAHLQTVDSLKYFNYWCTASMGRFHGIAADYTDGLGIVTKTNFNIYNCGICENNIRYYFATEVGQPAVGTTNYSGNQVVWNSFSFELRNLWMMDSIMFTFPDEYYYRSAYMKDDQIIYDTIADIKKWNVSSNVSGETLHPYNFGYERITDTSVTLYFDSNYYRIQEWVNNEFTAWDETKRYRIYCNVGIEDCVGAPDSISSVVYPVFSYWSNFPGTTTGDTIIEKTVNDYFIKPQAVINAQQIGPSFNIGNSELYWDLNLSSWNPACDLYAAYETWDIMAGTENTFVYFESPSGNIVVDSVYYNGSPLPVINVINNFNLFGVGSLSCSVDAPLDVYASYDCSNGYQAETLITYYGWNCYNYPDTIALDSTICFIDTIVQVIEPMLTGLTTGLYAEDTVTLCDTVTYYLDLTGNGVVENIQVFLNNTNEYTYLDSSAYLVLGSNIYQIEPQYYAVDSMVWFLDSISSMQHFSDEATLVFNVIPSCGFGYSGQELSVLITSENYCGLQSSTTESFIPSVILGLPELDSLSVLITAGNINSCNDSSLVSVIITNLGNNPTGAFNTVDVELPAPFEYSSGDAFSQNNGNILTFNLPAGIASLATDTIEFYIQDTSSVSCIDSLQISACVNAFSQFICSLDTCYYSNSIYNSCDTATFNITLPDVVFSGNIEMTLCNADTIIELEIINNSAFTSDSLFINYYCIADTAPITPCLFWTEQITGLAGIDSLTITSYPDSICANCTQMMAVLSGSCICENDTIIFNFTNVVQNPVITDININNPCIYAGTDIFFNSTTINATGFLWDFGDGITSTAEFAEHNYTLGGYYNVTLTASNLCGSTTYSENIYVLPDVCACNTVNGGTIVYDYTNGYSVSTGTTEVWSGNVYVEGDITVEQSAELIINTNTIVHFAPNGRIIVKEAGKLKIKQNSLLTNLGTTCNFMWQGIEVWGYEALGCDTTIQGYIHIREGVSIENAHIAVLLGARKMDAVANFDPSIMQKNYFDKIKAGGVIIISDGFNYFKNNGIDIKFLPKAYPHKGDCNAIVESYFVCTPELIDENYNINNITHYPNANNPWAGYANADQRTSIGIDVNLIRDFEILGSNFNNADTCIKSFDASFKVERSSFIDANYGLYAINLFTSLNSSFVIKECDFDKIHNNLNTGAAIYIMGGENDRIYNNEFQNTTLNANNCDYGIQLDFTSDYEITENEFRYYKKGIIATFNITGFIGAAGPFWVGNAFNGCRTGIETNWANNNLILKCNDHTPYPLQYNVNWNNSGSTWFSLGDQGVNGTNNNDPAGNTFLDINRKQINTSKAYNYYHHLLDISIFNIYRPELQTGSALINRVATGASYGSNFDACSDTSITPPIAPLPVTNWPYSELVAMNTLKSSLNNTLDSLNNSIDGGVTDSLLYLVDNHRSVGDLKSVLITHSPLSDTVIYEIMYEDALIFDDVLPPGNFKNVMEYNMPVSDEILPLFNAYIQQMPQGIQDYLKELQVYNPIANTPTGIKREIGQLETKYYYTLDNIIDALLDSIDYRKDDALALLEYDGSVKSKQVLYSTYIEDGRYADAGNKLDEIEAFSLSYLQDYVDLNRKVLSLYINNKTIDDITSSDFDYVYNLAWKCPPNPAVYCARAIVEYLKGEHIPYCPVGSETKSMQFHNYQESQAYNNYLKSKKPMLGENYPDPFKDQTTIPYILPEKTEGKIIITDILGKLIEVIQVKSENREYVIKTKNWENGIYYYSLVIGKEVIETRKMIITK